jgi:hypothetical protein
MEPGLPNSSLVYVVSSRKSRDHRLTPLQKGTNFVRNQFTRFLNEEALRQPLPRKRMKIRYLQAECSLDLKLY